MAKQVFRLWTLAALIFSLAVPARAGVGRWTPYGPPESLLTTVAAVEGRLLAATAESGVYASTDHGLTWFQSSAGMGNERIKALAVDLDDHEVYAAGQGRFFRSDDGGAHWTVLGSVPARGQLLKDLLALAPGEPDVFFLAIDNFLYRSTDGGQTWTQVLSNASILLSVLVDPNDADSVFVGTAQPGDLLHSPDGGTTWEPVTDVQALPGRPPSTTPFSSGVPEITAAATTPATFFAISEHSLYRSADAGASWVEITALGSSIGFTDSIAAGPGSHPRIYTFQQNPGGPSQDALYASDDLGETWVLLTEETRGFSLRVDPTTGDLFSFEFDGVGIAAEGGAIWRFAPLGSQACRLSVYPRSTPKARFGQGLTYAVVGGRVWMSRNGQQGWSVLGRDLTEQCMAVRDLAVESRPNVLWAATDNSVYRSRDGGVTWTRSLGPVPLGDGVPFQGVTLVDSRTILYSGFGIWRSGDHGATWKKTLPGPVLHDDFDEPEFQRSVYRVRVDPDNPQIVYAGAIESGERHPLQVLPYLYQSLDAGRTWRRISDGGYVVAIDPSHPKTLYLGTRDGLLRSRDRGRHWTKISDFSIDHGSFVPNGSDLQVDPRNPRVLYAARGDGIEDLGVWRSVDGGVTWNPLRTGLDSLPAFELFLDPRRPGRLFVASEGLFEGIFGVPGR